MSTRGRRDLTEGAIVAALQKAGCTIHYVAKEVFDILVGRGEQTYILEIKSSTGKLTERQEKFRENWRGQYAVVRTPQEALKAVGL